ncbi:MAG: dephospho-CoA kinase [Myxococcota bacterium]|nr:dephospho-CoA kinase [Myxococcota bacterium]
MRPQSTTPLVLWGQFVYFESMLCGLTGGIGCGKTTVARLLVEHGAIRIDADQIARDVIKPGTEGFLAIIKAFGRGVLTDDVIDRGQLGKMVFADAHKRGVLNDITHPLIASASLARIQAALAQRPPLVVYEAALLVETGRCDDFRPLIVVSAPYDVQLNRIMQRDKMTREDAAARIDAQMPMDEKESYGDHIVMNHGTLTELKQHVDALWHTLLGGTLA